MKSKSDINPECGLRLKEMLSQKRITQLELSKRSGFTPQYISYIIQGLRPMTVSAANAFSKALGIRQEYLLCEDDYKDIYNFKKNQEVQNKVSNASAELEQTFHDVLKSINDIINQRCSLRGLVCSDEDLNEFCSDIENYINMRFEKWLIPRCQQCVLKVNNVVMTEEYLKLDYGKDFMGYFMDLLETNPILAEKVFNYAKDFASGKRQTLKLTPTERAQQWPELIRRLKKHNITIEFPSNFPLEDIPDTFYYSCLGMIDAIECSFTQSSKK